MINSSQRRHFLIKLLLFNLFAIISLSPSTMFSQENIVEGLVISKGEPVCNANVYILNLRLGTTSDEKGYFRIENLPPGKTKIEVSHINFLPNIKEINLKKDEILFLRFELREKTFQTEEVQITAYKRNTNEISSRSIMPSQVKNLPSLAEPDLLRSLSVISGVMYPNDFTTKFMVRGGSPDQNLILIDNAELYNPNHIGGIVSTFDIDIIEDVELKTGGYSSLYGGRLSSILLINTKKANSKKTTIKGGIGLLSSKLSFTGYNSKVSWVASIRRTYLDILTKLVPGKPDIPYNFTDLFSKITYTLTDRNLIRLSVFSSNDRIKYKDSYFNENKDIKTKVENFNWGSHLINLSTTSILKKNLYIESNLYISLNGIKSDIENLKSNNMLRDLTFKSLLSYELNENNDFFLGIESKNIKFNYDWKDIEENDDFDYFFCNSPGTFKYINSIKQFDMFFEGRYINNFSISYGLRLNKKTGFEAFTLCPVFSISYPVLSNLRIKGAYGQYYQNMLTSREKDINDNWDILTDFYRLYFPVEKRKPEKVSHGIIEIDYKLSPSITFNVQAFHKNYRNIYSLTGPDLLFEKYFGKSKGMEFYFEFHGNNFDIWFSYTLSNCTFNELISRYDKTHAVNVSGKFKISNKSSISWKWNFSSGFPYTPVIGKYNIINAYSNDLYSDIYIPREFSIEKSFGLINSARYPYYHRLDISYERYFQSENFNFTFSFHVLNVFNRKNYLAHYDELSIVENEYTYIKKSIGYFPFLPTVGLTFTKK